MGYISILPSEYEDIPIFFLWDKKNKWTSDGSSFNSGYKEKNEVCFKILKAGEEKLEFIIHVQIIYLIYEKISIF